jgi:hypothetical protein
MTKVEHRAFAWFLLCRKTNTAHGWKFSASKAFILFMFPTPFCIILVRTPSFYHKDIAATFASLPTSKSFGYLHGARRMAFMKPKGDCNNNPKLMQRCDADI